MVNELKQIRQIIVSGWCKGTLKNDKGEHCLMGAINKVVPIEKTEIPIYSAILNQIKNTTQYSSIIKFNDSIWTTKADVLKIIDATIEEELKNEHHSAS